MTGGSCYDRESWGELRIWMLNKPSFWAEQREETGVLTSDILETYERSSWVASRAAESDVTCRMPPERNPACGGHWPLPVHYKGRQRRSPKEAASAGAVSLHGVNTELLWEWADRQDPPRESARWIKRLQMAWILNLLTSPNRKKGRMSKGEM